MSAHHNSTQEFLIGSGSSITSYFTVPADEAISIQVTKTSTGSFIQPWIIQTSNVGNPYTMGPYTGSGDGGLWCTEEGPHSGSLLTSSTSQASVMAHIGNINSRYVRAVIPVYISDLFRITWHGKGSGR